MLKRMMACLTAVCLLAFWGSVVPAAAQHGMGRKGGDGKGPAILLVTFGTSIPSAQAAFANIEKKVKAAFPEAPVKWAYTSYIIREKLAKSGQHLDSPEVALAKLMDEGYTRVAIQSLHMIPGAEFHDLKVNAGAFKGMVDGFDQLRVGYPALSTSEDLSKAADAVMAIIPKERKKDEAVVWMGHGTHHPANAVYEAMMYRLQRRDPNVYMGAVEGTPALKDIKEMLLSKGVKKAWLMPFMSVAGDHAVNDLAGDEADSWKSVLTGAGVECVPVLKGLAEYDAFTDIWVDHLKAVMAHFDS
jgi:sirohydrochlorin cobaltochelatase